jgi:hypothetical protein
MRNIEFCAGYYEWAVFVDGELIHAFHDISELITDDMTAETVAELVDDLIWEWQEDCREHGGYCPIDEEETNELANAMKTAICNNYGIE